MSETDVSTAAATTTPSPREWVYSAPASGLRPGDHALLHGRPARIVTVTVDRDTVRLTGVDLFTREARETRCGRDASVEVPVVTRTQYLLRDITDGRLSLLVETTGETRQEIPLPDGPLGTEIAAAFTAGSALYVTVTAAMGREAASGCRAARPKAP
ncbi:hypothetical protein AB0D49_38705 [Streptomyces sp. NPDC048290]|uniref:hypothetical protein n=1 Tax=Streptomyces sp. NPDC048290 TaxID=3155811 RepID=UPI003412CC2F